MNTHDLERADGGRICERCMPNVGRQSEEFVRIGDTVRWVDLGETVIAFDLSRSEFFTMADIRAEIWRGIATQNVRSPGQLAIEWQSEYSFLVRSGLLCHDRLPPPRTPQVPLKRQRLSSTGLMRSIVSMNYRLREEPLDLIFSDLSRPVELRCLSPHRERQALSLAVAAFRRLEARCDRNGVLNNFLYPSIALFQFLFRAGFEVRHLIGIRHSTADVEAWVSLRGNPLMPASISSSQYATLSTLPEA